MAVIEVDRDIPTEGLLDTGVEDEGRVGARMGGCCRIRRRPDMPRPWSWSVTMGDLQIVKPLSAACLWFFGGGHPCDHAAAKQANIVAPTTLASMAGQN